MQNVITNENGQFKSAVGPQAVQAYRLRTIIVMLRSELRAKAAGVKMPLFKVSALKAAKAITGDKSNDRAKQITKLTLLMEAALAETEIVGATPEARECTTCGKRHEPNCDEAREY